MTIEDVLNKKREDNPKCSFAVLAERVPESPEAPHKIAVLQEPIKPDEPVVLVLPAVGANVVTCNGLLKRVNDFVKNNDKTKQARVCIAIYDSEQHYISELARAAVIMNKRYPVLWFLMKYIGHHPWTCNDPKYDKSGYAELGVFYDIYNSVVRPKIIDTGGNRLATQQMLKNIRTLTIVGYCAGGHVAMKLEEIIKKEMSNYGYNQKEIKTALGQILVVGYAMRAPSEKSDLRFFNFNSVYDHNYMDPIFTQYLHLFRTESDDFGLMHFSQCGSDTFLCQSIKYQNGIVVAVEIQEYLKKQEKLAKIELYPDHIENRTDSYSEHSFLGFVEKDGFSDGARKLQSIFKSVIANSVENSILNSRQSNFISLPETLDLIGDDNVDDYGKSNVAYLRENTIYQLYRPYFAIICMVNILILARAARRH